jgi:hypothetical protein
MIPPSAAATPGSLAAWATFDAPIPRYVDARSCCVVPAAFTHLPPVQVCGPCGPISVRGPLPGGGTTTDWPGDASRGLAEPTTAPVTVTSVPTPYSAPSTPDSALATPAEAADTVTTRPTPTARPSATITAWRILQLSSRRR